MHRIAETQGFTFLHCADLHLDAPLGNAVRASLSDELTHEEKNRLRDAPLRALSNIKDAALAHRVSCVIMAGDLFDGRDSITAHHRIRSRFREFLVELAEHDISVFIALGNHDPLASIHSLSTSWPDNTHIFSSVAPETFTFTHGQQTIAIHGVSYASNTEDRDLSLLFPHAIPGAINVGVLHTNVGGAREHKSYAPSTQESLARHRYDYFALGHIHTRSVISTHPYIAYSGNTQGLSMKPSGRVPKGCNIVHIASPSAEPQVTFVTTDSVRYVECSVDARTITNDDDVLAFINDQVRQACESSSHFYLVRIRLTTALLLDNINALLALNDARSNYFVTELLITHSLNDDNIESHPFYQELYEEINKTTLPTFEDLYAQRSSALRHFINLEELALEDLHDGARDIIVSCVQKLSDAGAK